MNLRQLEIFVAIVETGSFSRAAAAVLLTQSTVSQHIAALEEEVGLQLLDRTGQGIRSTGAGALLLKHARRVLAERDALQQALAGFGGLRQASLTVGASTIPAGYLIPAILPRLTTEYPGIALTVQTGDSRTILERLLADEVELAVSGSRGGEKGLDYRPLTGDLLVLAVGRQHPWSCGTPISLDELNARPLVVRDSGSGSDQALRQALRQAGGNPEQLRIAVRLGSNEAVRQVLLGGFGAAFLSELAIRQDLQRGELIRVPVTGLTVQRQFWLVTRSQRTVSPAARVFCELLLESCADA